MIKLKVRTFFVNFLLLILILNPVNGQFSGGDILNEAPLTPVPMEMTFEEYQDMNRRLTVGLALAAIPIPGMIHFYAGEKKTGLIILGTAAAGLGSILVGAASLDDGDFPESDFNLLILNPGDKEKERQYEKIPLKVTGMDTTYKLREIFKEQKGGSGALIILGAALILGDIAYDFIHGIRTIENKRDRVRYKYGQQLGFTYSPTIDLNNDTVGFRLSYNF